MGLFLHEEDRIALESTVENKALQAEKLEEQE